MNSFSFRCNITAKIKTVVAVMMAASLVLSCNKNEPEPEPPGPDPEAKFYAITFEESGLYSVAVQDSAKAGESVEVTVGLTDPAIRVTSIMYNDSECKRVSYDESSNSYVYSFTMPEEDVLLTVNTSSLRFGIVCETNELWQYSGASEAIAGDQVDFSITVVDNTYGIISVSYGEGEDETCTLVGKPEISNTMATYNFTFTMPEKDVTLSPVAGTPVNRIYRQYYEDGTMTIRVQNHYRVDFNDPTADEYGNVTDPDDPYWPGAKIVESAKGETVLFLVDFALGYDSPDYHQNNPDGFITVTGLYTGAAVPIAWTLDPLMGLQAWGFTMPAEPVLIESKTTELSTYAGEEFVGDYDGFYIHYGVGYSSTVQTAVAPDVDFDLGANTVFNLKSSSSDRTPGYEYDIMGLYTYDENTGIIEYDFDSCRDEQGRDKDGFGISGTYGSEAWIVSVVDLEDGGLSENFRYYFSMKESAGVTGFISASNENGNRFLFQVAASAGTQYWYYDASGARTLYKAEADFSGKDINEEGAVSKINDESGETLVKYSFANGVPVFMLKGAEAGTYSGESGELVLDGFGEGSLAGTQGTYDVDGNIVVFTDASSVSTTMTIDKVSHTYALIGGEGEWDGPTEFSLITETGVGGPSNKVFITVTLDSGEKGQAKIQARFFGPYNSDDPYAYGSEELINDTQAYVYDSSAETLIISNVLQGKSGAWGSERKDIVFEVSPDKGSLTFTIDWIISTANPNKYVGVTGLSLTAVK